MKISDILKKEHVIKELNSCDKKNVLDELVYGKLAEGDAQLRETVPDGQAVCPARRPVCAGDAQLQVGSTW